MRISAFSVSLVFLLFFVGIAQNTIQIFYTSVLLENEMLKHSLEYPQDNPAGLAACASS